MYIKSFSAMFSAMRLLLKSRRVLVLLLAAWAGAAAARRTTLARTYHSASSGLVRMVIQVSYSKLEKVVNPPRNPTTRKRRQFV